MNHLDWPKRSFLRLASSLDGEALLDDYLALPEEAWKPSHWTTHGSVDMVLLRGGSAGTDEDFSAPRVTDHELLATLPYFTRILGKRGPLGYPTYAFLFRMRPFGIARTHRDRDEAWKRPFRVHIPILTNEAAFVLVDGRRKHFAVGEAWTFDNQAEHGAVNGDGTRVHLIVDVHRNPRLDVCLEHALFDPGEDAPADWTRAECCPVDPPALDFFAAPLSALERRTLGVPEKGLASRVEWVDPKANDQLAPGDVVWAIDGIASSECAWSASDYIQLRHRPGDTVRLDVLRSGHHRHAELYLRPASHTSKTESSR